MKMRYIRWYALGSTANIYNHIVELQAFEKDTGINKALNKTVTSNVPSATNLSLVTDGTTDTNPYCSFGTTRLGQDCYVQVDLGESFEIDSVVVFPYWGDVRTYHHTRLHTSVDGTYWNAPYDSAIHGEMSNGAQQVTTAWTTSQDTTTSWTTTRDTTTSWTTSKDTTTSWTTSSNFTTSWTTSFTTNWTTQWETSFPAPDNQGSYTTYQSTSRSTSRVTSQDTTTSWITSRTTTTSWTTSQDTTTSFTTSQSTTTSWTTHKDTSVDSNGIVIDCSSSLAVGNYEFPLYEDIHTQVPRVKVGEKYLQLTSDTSLCPVRPRIKVDISGVPYYIQQIPSKFTSWTTGHSTSQDTTTSWTTSQGTTTSWTTSRSTTTSWTTSQNYTTTWNTSYTTSWTTSWDTHTGGSDSIMEKTTSKGTSRTTNRDTSVTTTTSWTTSQTTTTSWTTSQTTTTSWTTSQSTTTSWTTSYNTCKTTKQGGWI
jgi:hypothetical protein